MACADKEAKQIRWAIACGYLGGQSTSIVRGKGRWRRLIFIAKRPPGAEIIEIVNPIQPVIHYLRVADQGVVRVLAKQVPVEDKARGVVLPDLDGKVCTEVGFRD